MWCVIRQNGSHRDDRRGSRLHRVVILHKAPGTCVQPRSYVCLRGGLCAARLTSRRVTRCLGWVSCRRRCRCRQVTISSTSSSIPAVSRTRSSILRSRFEACLVRAARASMPCVTGSACGVGRRHIVRPACRGLVKDGLAEHYSGAVGVSRTTAPERGTGERTLRRPLRRPRVQASAHAAAHRLVLHVRGARAATLSTRTRAVCDRPRRRRRASLPRRPASSPTSSSTS